MATPQEFTALVTRLRASVTAITDLVARLTAARDAAVQALRDAGAPAAAEDAFVGELNSIITALDGLTATPPPAPPPPPEEGTGNPGGGGETP
jgi:hypothetical protein